MCSNRGCKMVEERTQGKVKIKTFFSSTLAPPQESFDATASGVCDMAESYTFGNPGRFALSEMLMLPEMGFPTALAPVAPYGISTRPFPRFRRNTKASRCSGFTQPPAAKLNTKKKAVKTLEDLKGMKIAVSGATMVKVGKALGLYPGDDVHRRPL